MNSFTLTNVSKVETAYNRLNPAKAAGLDSINIREIKNAAQEFNIGLSTVINKIFLSKAYPATWKTAKVNSQ